MQMDHHLLRYNGGLLSNTYPFINGPLGSLKLAHQAALNIPFRIQVNLAYFDSTTFRTLSNMPKGII